MVVVVEVVVENGLGLVKRVGVEVVVGKQFISSDPSLQSEKPSQRHRLVMQLPFSHSNWLL